MSVMIKYLVCEYNVNTFLRDIYHVCSVDVMQAEGIPWQPEERSLCFDRGDRSIRGPIKQGRFSVSFKVR
jgi:hypothetical protein